jgi:hypothetical protein
LGRLLWMDSAWPNSHVLAKHGLRAHPGEHGIAPRWLRPTESGSPSVRGRWGVVARALRWWGEAVLGLREGRGPPDKALHGGGNWWRKTDVRISGRWSRAVPELSMRFVPMAWCSWKSRRGSPKARGGCWR